MSVSFGQLNKLLDETISKLHARCADCVHVSEIDWNGGYTRLSGYCHSGDQNLINHQGCRSLYQKRKCPGFELSSDPLQAEKVERKIREAEGALEKYLHSSHVTTTVSDVDRVASEQKPAVGTAENRQPPTQIKPEFSGTR